MFYLLKGEKPTKKVEARGKSGEGTIEYIATRTREIINEYDAEGNCIGSIYITMSLVQSEGIETQKIQVAGNWENLRLLAGFGEGIPEKAPEMHEVGLEVIAVSKGKASKVKGMDYVDYGVSGKIDINKLGTSIEDYLYEIQDLKELAEEKGLDLSWAEKKNYKVLITDEEVEEFLEGLDKTTEIVGFDTETTGLLVNRTKRDKLVGISMSYEDHSGVYIPLLHKRFDNVKMGTKEFLKRLKPYIHRGSKKAKDLVTHNGGFDWRVLKMHGIDLNIVYDTFIRHGLMKISEAKYTSGLKGIAKRVLGYDVIELEDMYVNRTPSEVNAVKEAVLEQGLWVDDITRYKLERAEKYDDVKFDFRFASYEFSELYGSADADFPRLIHKLQDKKWDKRMDYIYRLEIALIPAIGEQEYFGIRAVESEFRKLYKQAVEKRERLLVDIYRLAGKEFNMNSPKQKSDLLFGDMGCPVLPRFRTKSGGLSTNANTMETLASFKNKDGSQRYPIVGYMSEYTKINTLINNFYKKLPNLIHDGYLFPSYKQLGTETGRLSCFAPNLQQTESTSRFHMVPDSDEYYFLICDYSQVEYRIMAGMSGEKKVVDFFTNNPESDYHILAYANMMDKKYEDVTSEERKTGKTLNFGTTYGLEDENLALKLYGDTTEFHQMMARQARAQYFAGVPVLRDYFEAVRDEAEHRGYAETLFGRRRDIPEFVGKNISEYKRGSGRRKAGNLPVQGTAADIMKKAMIRLRETFRRLGYKEDKVRLVLNVHDEAVIQVHKSINTKYILKYVREAMEMDMSDYGFPPLYIGANVGYAWSDGGDDGLEAPVLLMDEMIAEVEEKIAKGEELEPQVDQRAEWLFDIRDFALRQVQKEITENGYETEDECHANGRLVKYSKTFKNSDKVIAKILEKGYEKVKDVITEIEESEKYKWKASQEVIEQGKELEEKVETVEDTVKKLARYNKKENLVKIKLLEPDSGFFSALDKMLVSRSSLGVFKENQKYLNVSVQVEGGKPVRVKQRGLLSGFIPLLREYLTVHVTGGEYGNFEHTIEEVGSDLIKV